MKTRLKEVTFFRCALPVLSLAFIIIMGIVILPQLTKTTEEITNALGEKVLVTTLGDGIPLEFVFIFAAIISVINLYMLGYEWEEMQNVIVKKVMQLIPASLILFSIGIIVSSWIFSGTIPMLISYGLNLINPRYLYIIAFIVPSIFSMLTGTSWGSAGTIGVVIMGIAVAVNANLAIVAGAVVGGSYFGDKMSPLSDTTNIAALAVGVPLMSHVRSMLNTTGPAYILSAATYIGISYFEIPETNHGNAVLASTVALKAELNSLFRFDSLVIQLILLIPIVIVVVASIKKKPTVPTLVGSAISAALIGVIIQGFSINDMVKALNTGFSTSAIFGGREISSNVVRILNRGGLYSMVGPVITSIMVFVFVGTLDTINAIPVLVNRTFAFAKTRRQVIIASQISTAITNALTSNQTATSYIIAEAFKPKYNEMEISAKVLSRTLEDFGTMIENMLPWTATGIYMYGVLGISAVTYFKYQFISIYGFVVAIFLAFTGIGCFYDETGAK
jgi:NhaC family Na+:H+ antiporter